MSVIADTGPLVALFDSEDQWHSWAVRKSKELPGPLVTCEAVLTEVFFLLRRTPKGCAHFLEAIARPHLFSFPWTFKQNSKAVVSLFQKYSDLPASFADICIVQMASLSRDPLVWTTDEHFKIYRLPTKKKIPLVPFD